jgi:hypothetical protein
VPPDEFALVIVKLVTMRYPLFSSMT